MEGRGCNPELAAEPPLPRGRDVTEKPGGGRYKPRAAGAARTAAPRRTALCAAIVARTGAWMPTWQGQVRGSSGGRGPPQGVIGEGVGFPDPETV